MPRDRHACPHPGAIALPVALIQALASPRGDRGRVTTKSCLPEDGGGVGCSMGTPRECGEGTLRPLMAAPPPAHRGHPGCGRGGRFSKPRPNPTGGSDGQNRVPGVCTSVSPAADPGSHPREAAPQSGEAPPLQLPRVTLRLGQVWVPPVQSDGGLWGRGSPAQPEPPNLWSGTRDRRELLAVSGGPSPPRPADAAG